MAWILSNPHHSHIVYTYTDDRRLVEAVAFYTSQGLASEGAVILIVTEAHRHAIKRSLRGDANVQALEASGHLSFLDAAELMSGFMVGGSPDPKLFKAGIKTLIERAHRDKHTAPAREVRLFGEMTSLLCSTDSAAAECLEKLWNEIIKEYSVSLLCAHSVDGLGRCQLRDSLIKAHSHAIAW